jgi:hypothetical protein
MRATCPSHFFHLDLIIPKIFDEDVDDSDDYDDDDDDDNNNNNNNSAPIYLHANSTV